MGWVKKEKRSSKEIFNDIIAKFGKKWNILFMPSENGSPYEYFSDYIRDYHDVTLKQCDEICVMIKDYYHIKQFYYDEIVK